MTNVTPQSKTDDRSEDHLRWLVDNRSRNQRATLRLYLLIEQRRVEIDADLTYAWVVRELAGVAFSLWRAVFLSDLVEEAEEQLTDAAKFLSTLISHNAIAYPQDRTAREWSFPYYLDNARHRLKALAARSPNVVESVEIDTPVSSAKDDWSLAQQALDNALERFEEILRKAGE